MSYDLFFRSRPESPPLTPEAFQAWFQARPHYQVSGGEALYENEATGVHFSFNLSSGEELEDDLALEEDEEEPAPRIDAAFNLNYFRPHVFALEAEPEVAAFVSHFSLEVEDPQVDGMGSGTYSREGFLRGWNAGNAFAHRAFRQKGEGAPQALPLSLPGERLEHIWRWNHGRTALQESLGERVFVPRISFLEERGVALSFVVWGDAIPIVLPEGIERVVLVREALATGWLFKRRQTVLLDAAAIADWVRDFPVKEGVFPYRLLDYQRPPRELVRAFKTPPAFKGQLKLVPADQVLDAELVIQAGLG
jgi:hypothetical protein